MNENESREAFFLSRREALTAGMGLAAAVAAGSQWGRAQATDAASPSATKPVLSLSPMNVHANDTALVVIDPQNDVLSEKGISWPFVGDSVKENNTVQNLARLFQAAKNKDFGVFISPHFLFPSDQAWRFAGAAEKGMLVDKEFFRLGPLSLEGFPGSGADWLESYKSFIEDGKTVVVSPHKVWGPQTNDLVLQLRKRRISKVILAGMLANLCVESHLRELLEQGFEVAVVKDATAGPRHPVLGDGYKAAVVNYGFIANAVLSTDEAVKAMTMS